MDPDTALAELRSLVAEYSNGEPFDDQEQAATMLGRMVELTEELDNWLKRGGFLPRDWAR